MTQKEINVINAILSAGIETKMWGLQIAKSLNDTRYIYGTIEHHKVPAHIYVYREDDDVCRIPRVEADVTVTDECGQTIDLYFIKMEGGEQ